jgi:D-lactate dehydrogenase
MKIAFFDTKPYDQKAFETLNKTYQFKIDYFESRLKEASVSLTKDYDVVCVFVRDDINNNVVDKLAENGVKLIALRCAGYNNVDFEAAEGKIKVVRVPAYSPYAVAEFGVGLMMTLNRKLHKAYTRTREANFSLNGLTGFDVHGKTIGIIGTGKIAKIFIQILKGFGTKIVAYDVYPDAKAAEELGYEYVDLDALYKSSDVISLHCPLTKETHHIINQESIRKMKDGVMLLNTGRGKLIDTIALIEGLKNKKIGSAGLDVYEEEEAYFYEDYSTKVIDDDTLSRLIMFPNVLITSHQAFLTKEALANIAETTLESIEQFGTNQKLTHEIAYICDEDGCEIKDVK